MAPQHAALLLLLVAGSAALRAQPHEEAGAFQEAREGVCAAEPPELLEWDLPKQGEEVFLNRQVAETSQQRTSELEANLTYTRECWSRTVTIAALSPLVVPRLKLALCMIPKVACTQFKDLFNDMNGELDRHNLPVAHGFGRNYLTSMVRSKRMNRLEMTKENGWKFAVFTRDPALRYLSAFGSACTPDSRGRYEMKRECCGPMVPRFLATEKFLVDAFERRVMSDVRTGLPRLENHWVEQVAVVLRCGVNEFGFKKVDFHGELSGDVHAQVHAMLKMVGANETDLKFADRYFPKNNAAGHQSPIHMSADEFYRKPEILRAVQKLYEDDYKYIPHAGCAYTDRRLQQLQG